MTDIYKAAQQALEEAAVVAVDSVAFCGGTVETEAYVRAAIRQLKDKP